MTGKSVDTLPQNGPFLHSGYTYPLPLSTPAPSPQINVVPGTLKSFFLLQTTLIRGMRGFTEFQRNEVINELNVC